MSTYPNYPGSRPGPHAATHGPGGTDPISVSALGITKEDVGLGDVDNTSDADKPVSTAQAAADTAATNSAVATAAADATAKVLVETNRATAAEDALGDLIEPRSNPGLNVSFTFEGDSLTAGSSVGAGEGFVDYLSVLPSVTGRGTVTNVATGGETLAQCISQYTAQVYPHRPAATGVDRAYLFIWAGANGWINYASPASFVSALEGYINTAKADGFTVIAFTIIDNLNSSYAIGNPMRQAINEGIRRSSAPNYRIDVDRLFPNAGDIRYFLSDGTHLNASGNALLAQHIDSVLYHDLNKRDSFNLDNGKSVTPVDRNPVVFTGASGGYFSGAIPNIGTQGFTLDMEFTPDENNSASRFLFNISDHATGPDRPYAFYGFISNTAGNRSLVIGLSGATTSDYRRATVANFVTQYASSAGVLSRRVAVPVRVQIVRGAIASGVGSDLTILINGQVVDYTTTTNGTAPATWSDQVNSAYYLVGSRGSSASEFTGTMSRFDVWNSSLNLAECAAIYRQGRHALPWYSRGDYTDVPSGSLVRGKSYRVSGGTSITNGSSTYNSGTIFNHVGSSNTYTESGSPSVFEVGPLVSLDFSTTSTSPLTTLFDRSGNANHATLQSAVLRTLPHVGNVAAVSGDNGDAAATLTAGVSASVQRWNTAITADRAATLSTTGAHMGSRFRIVREASATGAFNLNVGTGPLKALGSASTWCEVEYDGTAWRLTASGTL